MKLQQFIERAIEGGWPRGIQIRDDALPHNRFKIFDGGIAYSVDPTEYLYTEEILLDPEAWKAVGKVEGWPEDYKPRNNGHITRGGWYLNMHSMIDALADGKTIEQFLETL